MSKLLILVLACATVLMPPTLATTLNGEVSTDEGISSMPQEKEQSLTPDMTIRIGQIRRLVGGPSTFIVIRKNGTLDSKESSFSLEMPRGDETSTLLQGSAEQEPSALGFCWQYPSCAVLAVDPSSDLKDKIVPGDKILAVDGLPPLESHFRRATFGNAGTTVQLTFSHNGAVQTLPCRRQPISSFSKFAQEMLNQTFGNVDNGLLRH